MRLMILLLLLVTFDMVSPHGRFVEPPSRVSAWRFGFPTLANYNDHETNCGGFGRQWQRNGGRCGVCGDPYDEAQPRAGEGGGKYVKFNIQHLAVMIMLVCTAYRHNRLSERYFQVRSRIDCEAIRLWSENQSHSRNHGQPQRILRVPPLPPGNRNKKHRFQLPHRTTPDPRCPKLASTNTC